MSMSTGAAGVANSSQGPAEVSAFQFSSLQRKEIHLETAVAKKKRELQELTEEVDAIEKSLLDGVRVVALLGVVEATLQRASQEERRDAVQWLSESSLRIQRMLLYAKQNNEIE